MSDADMQALKELALELVRAGEVIEAIRFIRSQTGYDLRDAALRLCAFADQDAVKLPDLSIFRL